MPHRVQSFESNGPSVKIRGNAYQVFERYLAMAREAQASGDRVAAENLYQHAEHYFRVMNAQGDGQGHGPPRPTTPADTEMGPEAEPRDAEPRDGEPRDGEPRDGEPREAEQAEVQQVQAPAPHPIGEEQPPGFRSEY